MGKITRKTMLRLPKTRRNTQSNHDTLPKTHPASTKRTKTPRQTPTTTQSARNHRSENIELLFGKIPPEILERTVFRHLGARRADVVLGPSTGEDAAVVRWGDDLLVVSCDPISGAVERIGWLAVNVATNDVATRGVRPCWFVSCILLPKGFGEESLSEICGQMDEAACRLGVSIIGGHSEITPGLDHPLVIGFAMGVVEDDRYVTCSGAKPGDCIILTKGGGIEGTAILASERGEPLTKKFGERFVDRARQYFNKISVVDDALTAFKFGGVSAMHDPTEGGLAGGLHEVADASGTGFKVYEEKITFGRETLEICRFFGVNPLSLISSGALLIMAEPEKAGGILDRLRERDVGASIIGNVLKDRGRRVIVRKDGSEEALIRPMSDELWTALAKEL